MDVRQLRYFVAVADAGSLSGAARSLFITQPTLTVAMKKLDAELKTSLLRQVEGRYELTETGEILYEEGREILERLDDLEQRIREHDAAPVESLRVGLTVLFSIDFMEPISRFIATHPGVELTLVQGGSPELQKQLADGRLDLGLVAFPSYAPGLVMEPLPARAHSYPVSVVMRRDNPLASRDGVGMEDLAGERFSSLSENYMLGHVLREQAPQAGFEPDIVFGNDSWEVLLSSVAQLGTVCLLPTDFSRVSRADGVVWVPLRGRAGSFPIGIATVRGAERSGVANEFIELIRRA